MTQTDTDAAFGAPETGFDPSPAGATGGDAFRARAAFADPRPSCDAAAVQAVQWKRATDIIVALLLILFFLPAFAVIAICLLVQDGRPIFYSQTRIGRNGAVFSCLKFRSMAKNSNTMLARLLEQSAERRTEWETTQKLRDDPRVHKVGRILRRSSLDELPQLLNVLNGDMSIVGPRPIVREEISRYGSKFAAYQSVRPGITGLWQVSGRNRLSYSQRVELDARYVNELSFRRDLAIILKTVLVVLLVQGDF